MRDFTRLAVVGTAMPLAPSPRWPADHGLDPSRFVAGLFANRVSAFLALAVIVAAGVLIRSIPVEGALSGMRRRLPPIAAIRLIGVSCRLPLFLAMRERAIARGWDPVCRCGMVT